jgi:hypothetical protein
VVDSHECCDEPSGSGARVSWLVVAFLYLPLTIMI